MKDTYLNDFHRERSERVKRQLATQPKVTLEEALAQYDRIKRQSSRRAAMDDEAKSGAPT